MIFLNQINTKKGTTSLVHKIEQKVLHLNIKKWFSAIGPIQIVFLKTLVIDNNNLKLVLS